MREEYVDAGAAGGALAAAPSLPSLLGAGVVYPLPCAQPRMYLIYLDQRAALLVILLRKHADELRQAGGATHARKVGAAAGGSNGSWAPSARQGAGRAASASAVCSTGIDCCANPAACHAAERRLRGVHGPTSRLYQLPLAPGVPYPSPTYTVQPTLPAASTTGAPSMPLSLASTSASGSSGEAVTSCFCMMSPSRLLLVRWLPASLCCGGGRGGAQGDVHGREDRAEGVGQRRGGGEPARRASRRAGTQPSVRACPLGAGLCWRVSPERRARESASSGRSSATLRAYHRPPAPTCCTKKLRMSSDAAADCTTSSRSPPRCTSVELPRATSVAARAVAPARRGRPSAARAGAATGRQQVDAQVDMRWRWLGGRGAQAEVGRCDSVKVARRDGDPMDALHVIWMDADDNGAKPQAFGTLGQSGWWRRCAAGQRRLPSRAWHIQ